jgi:dTDP-4-dehydrorhamnose 3,5-epimerase
VRFTPTSIPEVVLLDVEPIVDDRGWFARSYCAEEFAAHGLEPAIAQANISVTAVAGTIRGMHYQVAPAAETKVVRCVRGAVHDIVVDVRPDSPSFLQHVAVDLDAASHRALYVPTGFAHGFQTLLDDTEVEYLMGAPYTAGTGRGLRFDDPALALRWPLEVTVVSGQDRAWPAIAGREESLLR